MWRIKKRKRNSIKWLKKINNTNYNKLLNAIKYNYYSKRYGNGKSENAMK